MNIQLENFVFIVIISLLALFVYTWAFCFDIPGTKEGTKRWDLLRIKWAKKKTPRLCARCVRKEKYYRLAIIVHQADCIACKRRQNER